MATSAPAAARQSARLLPMRLAAPVTSAVFGCRVSKLLRQGRLLRGLGAVRFALWSGVVGRSGVAIAIERILLTRPLHLDHNLFAVTVDLVIVAVGLPTIGNHLQTHCVPNGDHVDRYLAVFIALELQRSLILISFHGVDNDCGVGDGLAIGGPEDRDFNGGGGRRRRVFAPVPLIRGGTKQRKTRQQQDSNRNPTAKAHGEKYR